MCHWFSETVTTMNSYKRVALCSVVAGAVSMAICIIYTDSIRSGSLSLPNLTHGVRMTVCSVWERPCGDASAVVSDDWGTVLEEPFQRSESTRGDNRPYGGEHGIGVDSLVQEDSHTMDNIFKPEAEENIREGVEDKRNEEEENIERPRRTDLTLARNEKDRYSLDKWESRSQTTTTADDATDNIFGDYMDAKRDRQWTQDRLDMENDAHSDLVVYRVKGLTNSKGKIGKRVLVGSDGKTIKRKKMRPRIDRGRGLRSNMFKTTGLRSNLALRSGSTSYRYRGQSKTAGTLRQNRLKHYLIRDRHFSRSDTESTPTPPPIEKNVRHYEVNGFHSQDSLEDDEPVLEDNVNVRDHNSGSISKLRAGLRENPLSSTTEDPRLGPTTLSPSSKPSSSYSTTKSDSRSSRTSGVGLLPILNFVPKPESGEEMNDVQSMPSLALSEPWTGRSIRALVANARPSSLDQDYKFLQHHLTSGGLNLSMLSDQDWPEEPIPWVLDLLYDAPLRDSRFAASHVTSRLSHLNPKTFYKIGDVITLRIDVHNTRGLAMSRGGDEVRVWLVERAKNASVAGHVTDLQNGSYLAKVKVQWTGVQQVQAELTYPREILRTYYYLREVSKCLRFVVAGFTRAHLSEATLCSPYPIIPMYSDLCNFTNSHYGTRWYCGQPRTLGLTCADWVSIRDIEFYEPLPLTSAESDLSDQLRLPPPFRLIPSNVILHVTHGIPTQVKKACKSPLKIANSRSWQLTKSRGFFLHGQWVRTDCRPSPMTPHRVTECLRNTSLILTGDSNLLMMFDVLVARTGCMVIHTHRANWHRPRSCLRQSNRFHMSWALHGFPVHPVSDHWAWRSDFRDITDQLDSVPDKGEYVVVVHLFIHFSMHHHNVFINHLRAIRLAVERLLQRNPSGARVLVRGPHTAYKGWPPILGGDMAGPLMRELIVKEFEGLHDRVLYLDFWDMTIAAENPEFHPQDFVNNAMVDVMLQHLC